MLRGKALQGFSKIEITSKIPTGAVDDSSLIEKLLGKAEYKLKFIRKADGVLAFGHELSIPGKNRIWVITFIDDNYSSLDILVLSDEAEFNEKNW